jgi:putative phage-type endonuclease
MEERLREWLLDNRPYTHLNHRLKHFILFCKTLEPRLSYTVLKRYVFTLVDRIMLGEVGRLWQRDRCYERVLRMYGSNDQRTDGWHAKRGEMITASEVYGVFGSESARREVMMRKLEPRPPGDGPGIPALLWGTRFEPIAKRIYEERTKCTITDVSCVQHPVHTFLGASPDGLIVPNDATDVKRYGRLVEFKCPISRAMKAEIPPGYVHQMQMQMECTGIDECEYVEFRFKQVNYSEWTKTAEVKGAFTVYEDGKVIYDQEVYEDNTQVIYWILGSIKEDFVPKDLEWLPKHLEGLRQFWNEVLDHRKNGTLPPKPEEKKMPSLDL